MNRLFSFFRTARANARTRRWALTQGFTVGRRRTSKGRTCYPVFSKYQPQLDCVAEVEDLSELPRLIHSLRESGQAYRPGEFYVYWEVRHQEGTPPWCRTPSWVRIAVREGIPPNTGLGDSFSGFDSTPYASPQEAVDTIAFLGLELGARLEFYADVRYLTGKTEDIPTPGNNRKEIEEMVLGVVRDCAYASMWGYGNQSDVEYVARRLLFIGLPVEQGMQAVNRMIAEGRLVRPWQYERFWWRRWLVRWQNRGRICLAEPGWKRLWVPCENCSGTGKCPACQGTGWRSKSDAHGNPWPCFDCYGGRYVRDEPKRSRPGDGICRRCEGERRGAGPWQQIGETAQTAGR